MCFFNLKLDHFHHLSQFLQQSVAALVGTHWHLWNQGHRCFQIESSFVHKTDSQACERAAELRSERKTTSVWVCSSWPEQPVQGLVPQLVQPSDNIQTLITAESGWRISLRLCCSWSRYSSWSWVWHAADTRVCVFPECRNKKLEHRTCPSQWQDVFAPCCFSHAQLQTSNFRSELWTFAALILYKHEASSWNIETEDACGRISHVPAHLPLKKRQVHRKGREEEEEEVKEKRGEER